MLEKTYIGTTEAAYLLGLSQVRVRQLLRIGRIKGAIKIGGLWHIPLFNGMPKVEKKKSNKGPKGTWNQRRQKACNNITVHQKKITKNNKAKNIDEKVILLKRGDKTFSECHYVEINGPCRVIYHPNGGLHCGAKVWIEVDPRVKLISRSFTSHIKLAEEVKTYKQKN